jgi:hypothetical protein
MELQVGGICIAVGTGIGFLKQLRSVLFLELKWGGENESPQKLIDLMKHGKLKIHSVDWSVSAKDTLDIASFTGKLFLRYLN